MTRRHINIANEREPDPFRRLVTREISADDYVRGLERRVRERHVETERGPRENAADEESSDE